MAKHHFGLPIISDLGAFLTAAAIDTVHAEAIAPNPDGGGTYEAIVTVGCGEAKQWRFEHRDAANAANVDVAGLYNQAAASGQFRFILEMAKGERVSVVNTTAVTAGITSSASVQIMRMK